MTPESGTGAGYDEAKRKRGSKVHMAVDTLGHLLALHVTPADVGDRAAVGRLCTDIQDETGEEVQLAYIDQGYTGEAAADAAQAEGIASDLSPGRRAAAASSKTMSDTPQHSRASTTSPSLDTCSSKPQTNQGA